MKPENVTRIREAYAQAAGVDLTAAEFASLMDLAADAETHGVTGAAETALRYLSQGLPSFRGELTEWSFQATFFDRTSPHKVLCRLWWPRFVAELSKTLGRTVIARVHWVDDPVTSERRVEILTRACDVFMMRPPENEA
jgi:hypothetical protein